MNIKKVKKNMKEMRDKMASALSPGKKFDKEALKKQIETVADETLRNIIIKEKIDIDKNIFVDLRKIIEKTNNVKNPEHKKDLFRGFIGFLIANSNIERSEKISILEDEKTRLCLDFAMKRMRQEVEVISEVFTGFKNLPEKLKDALKKDMEEKDGKIKNGKKEIEPKPNYIG